MRQFVGAPARDGMVVFLDNPGDRGARLVAPTEAGPSAPRHVGQRRAEWASAVSPGCRRCRWPTRDAGSRPACYPAATHGDSAPRSSSPLPLSRKDMRKPSALLSTHT